MAKAKRAIPEGYHTVSMHITCDGAAQAIDWYKKALGAEERVRMPDQQGKIMHAEIKIGDTIMFLSDMMMGNKSPKQLGGTSCRMVIYVEDCDSLFNRAVQAGAKATMPIADMFWGDRWGNIIDPYGHEWAIATHKEDLTPQEIQKRQEEWMKQMGGKQ